MRIVLVLVVFLLYIKLQARYYPQLVDFLCGCEHCETVSRSEPLIIGTHMLRCHSWRDATLRTMEIMEQMKKPEVEIKKREEEPEIKIIKEQADEHVNIYNDYKWREDALHGFTYSTTHQSISTEDMWLYLEDLGWVWTFGKDRKFLYSENFEWIYAEIYKEKRILYWYDKRMWVFPSDIKKEYLK